MMKRTISKAEVSRRELRQFGVGLALLGGLIGGWALWSGHLFGVAALACGLLLALAFWFDVPGIRRVYRLWSAFGRGIGGFLIRVFLTILYFLLLTPLATLGRVCGRSFIERGFRSEQKSYWVAHEKPFCRQESQKQS